MAESLFLAEKGWVKARTGEIPGLVESALNYRFYPLDLSIIQIGWELKKIPEIHDRLIAATAKHLGLEQSPTTTRSDKAAKSKRYGRQPLYNRLWR